MPRRNLYLLWFLGLFCLLCYAQSDPLGRVLAQTLRRIQWRYLEEIDEEQLFEGAVDGMIYSLETEFGDRYSMYVRPNLVEEFDEELNQQFGGLGIEMGIDPKTGQLTVLSPIFGAPASLGGIQANDRIVAIDGVPVTGISFSDAKNKMRGMVGEPVTLRIQRPKQNNATGGTDEEPAGESAEEPPVELDVKLHRAMVKIDTVLGDTRAPNGEWSFMLEGHDKIGYIRIVSFADNTVEEVRLAIEQLKKEGVKGLILDLRDNPGGYLDSAVEVCDMFIDSGQIVSTRGRSRDFWSWFSEEGKPAQVDEGKNQPSNTKETKHFEERDRFSATEGMIIDKKVPIAVLINEDSASAAEIVAACLMDHHRAKIIGRRSYGKGTIQEILPVGGGRGVLKLTSASYWRPSGMNINRSKSAKEDEDWGVRPDPGFEVDIDSDTRKTILLTRRRRDLNYNAALSIPDIMLRSELDVKSGGESLLPDATEQDEETSQEPKINGVYKKDEQPEEETKKRLPLVDSSTPMIDVDPQLRKAVQWIEEEVG